MNQTLPSGPRVIAPGPMPPAFGNSVIVGAADAPGAAVASMSAAAPTTAQLKSRRLQG